MIKRVIQLVDYNGEVVREMDVSSIDNANSQFLFTVLVKTLCDMNEWHIGDRFALAPWGRAISVEN